MPKLSKRVTVMLATLSLLFGGAITAAHGQAQAAEGAARVPLAAAAPVSDAVAAAVADQFVESRIGRERTRRAAGDVMVRLAVTRGGNDLRYVSYDRTHSGLPVIGGDAVVVVNGDGEVAFVSVAQTEPIALATLGPAVLPPAAADAARAQFSSVTATGVPRLVVFAVSSPPSLAWDVAVDGTVDGEAARQRVFVNASTGALLARMGRDHDATGRGHYYGTVAINTTLADGVFTMVDSSRANLSCRDVNATTPFTDQDNVWGNGTSEDMVTACVDAMYGAAKTWDMLDAWFGRDGFDGNGGPSIQLKMDGSFLNNGVWLADQRTVLLGKSSQSLRWFSPLDLVGHELGHAVYHFTPGGSIFSNTEANAVNEAVADIFGTLTELFAAHAADPFDYTLGEEIETEPFRFMHDPSLTSGANCYPAEGFPPPSSGTRPPPSPHLAAGVVDHWFYLLAEGSNPTNGGPVSPTCNNRTLKGIGIGKARDIVFNSLLAKTADWQMGQMRLATLNVARNLYPNCVEFIAVRAAWDAVDVGVQAGEPECSMSLFGTADTVNVSDPFVMKCFDQTTGLNGYCMYTSQDLGVAGPAGNPYPMENTLGFFSTDGRNWTPKGVVFSESQLALWVPSGAQHLWAPAAMQDSNGTTHLFVPDVTNTSLPDSQHPWTTPNVHTSARTFVSGSMPGAGPFGPYWITLPITDEFGNDPGYMSDPEPFQDSTGRYLLWANGDGDTCGGLSVGRFGATISSVTQIQELTITGFPSTLATCSYKSPFANKEGRGASVNHPYMEGPSLFKLSDMSSRPGLPGPYTLVFAAKPTSRPSECISGTSSEYEVIAYATSSSVTGPYAYQGILMCGSTTEWTNQATLTTISTAAGAERLVMIYHDGPAGGIHNRRLHAECMFFGRGTIAGVVRSATGFADCMNGANADAWVLRSRRPKYAPPWGIVTANVDQGARLYASRSQVGPWERFDVLDQNGVPISPTAIGQWSQVRIRAQANNKWVCAENAGRGQLVANRSQVGAWEKFSLWAPDGVFAQLDSEESSLGVNTDTYQRLYPDSPPRAPQEYFDILHL